MRMARSASGILAALLGLAVAAAALAQPAPQTVRIGYQLPLTGETAQYGQDFRRAAEMALETFNASGRIPAKVEIVYEDSRSDAKEGINIARKFADDRSIVGVLGDFTSGVSMASAQVYKEAGMPQLSQTASHPDYAKISPWQFRNITTQAQEGPYNAKWMLGQGYRKIAVIAEQSDWGQSVVQGFSDAVKAQGGQIAFSEFFNRGTKDFRALIAKIERAKPDVVYTGFFYEDGAQFLKQMKQLGVSIPVHSTSAAYNPKLIELAGEAAEGLQLTATFLPSSPDPKVRAFVDEWKKRYGSEPGQFPAQAYDAVNIMLEAVARAYPNVSRERVREELAKTRDFPGVTGATSFDPETREPAKELTKAVVKDRRFQAFAG